MADAQPTERKKAEGPERKGGEYSLRLPQCEEHRACICPRQKDQNNVIIG